MSKGTNTKEAILDEGLKIVSSLGLSSLSIGRLAAAVGLSKSGLYAHFRSKEQLQIEILEIAGRRFIKTVVAPALAQPRGEPRIRALFDNWLAWSRSSYLPGGCVFIAAANELDDDRGPVRDFLVQGQKDWIANLSLAAQIAIAEGHFTETLDSEQFAYDFYSIVLAYHHFARLLQDPNADMRCHAAFEHLISTSLKSA
jgi:AcrR family transcriptional regulator